MAPAEREPETAPTVVGPADPEPEAAPVDESPATPVEPVAPDQPPSPIPPPPPVSESDSGSSEGARLLATQMAVAGGTREEITRRLREEFGIQDAAGLLDDIGL
jgi:hypothetical protein